MAKVIVERMLHIDVAKVVIVNFIPKYIVQVMFNHWYVIQHQASVRGY